MRRYRHVVTLVALVAALGACGSGGKSQDGAHQKTIGNSDLGADWPLTVNEGTVACRPGNAVVFTADGVTYALNGPAMDAGNYADVHPIWADDPDLGHGLKKGIGPLIAAGLALC